MWLQGGSGVGKTSMAWIIARMVAKDDFDIIEYDGAAVNKGAAHDISQSIGLCPMFGGWKVYIINEAHNLTAQAVQVFLTLLERLPEKRLIIFTPSGHVGTHKYPEIVQKMPPQPTPAKRLRLNFRYA